MTTYTPLPEWEGTVQTFFLLYMFPKGAAPTVTKVQGTFDGIFAAFSNRPREFVIVVYDASALPAQVTLTSPNYVHAPVVRFVQSQDKYTFDYYAKTLKGLGVTMTLQPSQFVRSSIFAQDPAKFSLIGGAPAVLAPQITPLQPLTYTWAAVTSGATAQRMHFGFAPLYLEGGNILQGNGFLLAGKNLMAEPTDLPNMGNGATAGNVLSELYGGIPVIGLGSSTLFPTSPDFWQVGYQPSFHIDNLVTPLGPQTLQGSSSPQMVMLTAQFEAAGAVDASGKEMLNLMNASMAEIVLQLKAQPLGGYEVATLSIPSLMVPNGSYGPYMLSWNNCIIEQDAQGLVAYLPVYTNTDPAIQTVIDQCVSRVEAAYQQLGARIIWVDNQFAMYCDTQRGSLHCMCCAVVRS